MLSDLSMVEGGGRRRSMTMIADLMAFVFFFGFSNKFHRLYIDRLYGSYNFIMLFYVDIFLIGYFFRLLLIRTNFNKKNLSVI